MINWLVQLIFGNPPSGNDFRSPYTFAFLAFLCYPRPIPSPGLDLRYSLFLTASYYFLG